MCNGAVVFAPLIDHAFKDFCNFKFPYGKRVPAEENLHLYRCKILQANREIAVFKLMPS
jgi:hypothetical protein